MTKLTETYFRLEITFEVSDQNKLRHFLSEQATKNARGLFKQDLEFAIYLVDGSLRGWLAGAGILYTAIAGYGGLRSGLDYILKDSRTFSERMIETVKGTGISEHEILRTERRTAIPGKLKRALDALDDLETRGQRMPKAQYDQKIDDLRQKFLTIIEFVDDNRDRQLILRNIPSEIRERLPKHLPRRLIDDYPVALRPEQTEQLEQVYSAPFSDGKHIVSSSVGHLIDSPHHDAAPTHYTIESESGLKVARR